jgi:hypothetical protein
MAPDAKPAAPKPARIAGPAGPNEPAVQYQLSINIVVAQPALDEARVRAIVGQEFDKHWKQIQNKTQ